MCGFRIKKVPYFQKKQGNHKNIYEFVMGNDSEFIEKNNCIENRIDIDVIKKDKNAFIVVSTEYHSIDQIKQWHQAFIKKHSDLKNKILFHSKVFFNRDKIDFPLISTITIKEKTEKSNDSNNWVGLCGDTCSSEYLALKAFCFHYDMIENVSCEGNYYDDKINTPLYWKYNPSWLQSEPGFRSLITKNCPFAYQNDYDHEVNIFSSPYINDGCSFDLSELIEPSIWLNTTNKDQVISGSELVNNNIMIKPIDSTECNTTVDFFREEFRQTRLFLSMSDTEKKKALDASKDKSEQNKSILEKNNGFILNDDIDTLKELTTFSDHIYHSVKAKSHKNICRVDFNETIQKSLVVVQSDDKFTQSDFSGSLNHTRIIKRETLEESKLVHILSELRRSVNSNMVVYIHGSIPDTSRVINTIKSLVNKGATIYCNDPQIKKTTKIRKLQSIQNNAIANELIGICRGGYNVTLKSTLYTDIPNESDKEEETIIDELRKKKNLVVPISDITNGIGITQYFEEHDIEFKPLFCGIILNDKMLNHAAYDKAVDIYGDRLENCFLKVDQFFNKILPNYSYAYLSYDSFLMWGLNCTGKLPYVVSLDKYKRMLAYHNYSKQNNKVGIYQHQFPSATTRLGDYDDVMMSINHELLIVDESLSKLYENENTN